MSPSTPSLVVKWRGVRKKVALREQKAMLWLNVKPYYWPTPSRHTRTTSDGGSTTVPPSALT